MPELLRRASHVLLWCIALTSLAINLYLAYALLAARRQAAHAFLDAAATVAELKGGTFESSVRIDQSLPLTAQVPISFTVQVPISRTIPLNTVVRVPVVVPLIGRVPLDVPINARVPISFTVDVPIQHTVEVDTTIPVHFAVPITVRIVDTPLAASLDQVEVLLLDVARSLGASATPPASHAAPATRQP